MKGEYKVNVFICFELKYPQLKYWKNHAEFQPTNQAWLMQCNAMQK